MTTPKRVKPSSPRATKPKPAPPAGPPTLRVVPRSPRRTVAPPAPAHEDIARRAYEIYLDRHGAAGDQVEDWLQAERELMAPARPKRRAASA